MYRLVAAVVVLAVCHVAALKAGSQPPQPAAGPAQNASITSATRCLTAPSPGSAPLATATAAWICSVLRLTASRSCSWQRHHTLHGPRHGHGGQGHYLW